MDRKAIREYGLILADELDIVADEGLFDTDTHDILINISQNRVLLRLGAAIPKRFRTAKLLNITVDKRVYSIATDLVITDFLTFQSILHNVTGKRATPLIEIDPEDEWRYEDMDELSYWGYEDKDNIFIGPTATSTVAERLKSYYFAELEDMDADDDEPDMPIVCRPLISIDVLKQFTLADEGSLTKVDLYFEQELDRIVSALGMKSNFAAAGQKPSVREVLASRDA